MAQLPSPTTTTATTTTTTTTFNPNSKPVEQWSSAEVRQWVEQAMEGKAKDAFVGICVENGIRGRDLQRLNQERLERFGVADEFHREQILDRIQEIKENSDLLAKQLSNIALQSQVCSFVCINVFILLHISNYIYLYFCMIFKKNNNNNRFIFVLFLLLNWKK